jgi:hypothetical protein
MSMKPVDAHCGVLITEDSDGFHVAGHDGVFSTVEEARKWIDEDESGKATKAPPLPDAPPPRPRVRRR